MSEVTEELATETRRYGENQSTFCSPCSLCLRGRFLRVLHRRIFVKKSLLMCIVAASLSVSSAYAQAPTNMPAYTPPKNSDGQPDLSGIWQVLNTGAWDLQDHGAQLGIPAGRGVVVNNDI